MSRARLSQFPSAELADLLPASVAVENRIIPIGEIGDTLVVASDLELVGERRDKLTFILNRSLRSVPRSSAWIDATLAEVYAPRFRESEAFECTCTFWPFAHWDDEEGTLFIKTTGFDGEVFWTGALEMPPDHVDRDFWLWVFTIPQFQQLIDEQEVPKLKRIWRRYLSRCGNRYLSR